MADNKSSSGKGGTGFIGLLTIAFIVLKLCHVIEWRWIWVLAPAWIYIIIWFVLSILLIFAGWKE